MPTGACRSGGEARESLVPAAHALCSDLNDRIKGAVGIFLSVFAAGIFLPLAIDDDEVFVLAGGHVELGPPGTLLIALEGAGRRVPRIE